MAAAPPAGESVARRNLFVIGASLGGIPAFQRLLPQLPRDLDASLFVVQHTSREGRPEAALAPWASLPLRYAVDGERFESGTIYVAPPDRHMLLEAKTLQVVRGPRENGTRPAIDPLFRSAAAHHGRRVVGIVLTGLRDDGAAGLQAIQRSGGVTVVQDPVDASFPDMPRNALQTVAADHVVPLEGMAELIVRLAREAAPEGPAPPQDVVREAQITGRYARSAEPVTQLGRLTQLDCPECGGPLWSLGDGEDTRFRCRIGHALSARALGALQGEQIERSLLVALRTLEERIRMLDRMQQEAHGRGHSAEAARFAQDRDDASAHAEVLRELLTSLS